MCVTDGVLVGEEQVVREKAGLRPKVSPSSAAKVLEGLRPFRLFFIYLFF